MVVLLLVPFLSDFDGLVCRYFCSWLGAKPRNIGHIPSAEQRRHGRKELQTNPSKSLRKGTRGRREN